MPADQIASHLDALSLHLSTSDGVVPVDSQSPAIFSWEQGDPIANSHANLPGDPAAITQILARVDSLVDAGHPRLVLLLGPIFLDRHAWDALLASPARTGVVSPDANFNLRATGVDPATVSLNDVSAVADYYTAELADDNSGDVSRLQGRSITSRKGSRCCNPAARSLWWRIPRRGSPRAPTPTRIPTACARLITLSHASHGRAAAIPHGLADWRRQHGWRQVLRERHAGIHAAGRAGPHAARHGRLSARGECCDATAAVPLSSRLFQQRRALRYRRQSQWWRCRDRLTDDPFAWLKAATLRMGRTGGGIGTRRSHPPLHCRGIAHGSSVRSAAAPLPPMPSLRTTLFQIPLHDGVAAPAHPKGLRAEIRLSRPGDWLLSGPALGDSARPRPGAKARCFVAGNQVSLELHDAAWQAPFMRSSPRSTLSPCPCSAT